MKAALNYLGYILVRGLFWVLGLLPQSSRIRVFRILFKLLFFLVPSLRRISMINLKLAFPEKDEAWRLEIFSRNITEMARLLADTVRLPSLDEDWARKHVQCAFLPRYVELVTSSSGKGCLIATGHLGSFELLGHSIGLFGYPLSAIARRFRAPHLDRWWTSLREARGNSIIDRRGAFKAMVADISAGRSVAVLFDQNVTHNVAVWPSWFGVPAATTKALALAALKTEAPLVVASMRYRGDDYYSIEASECPCDDIYRDETLSSDEKVLRITQRLSDLYCAMIREFPEGWFWLHRRWKSRPDEGERNPYE